MDRFLPVLSSAVNTALGFDRPSCSSSSSTRPWGRRYIRCEAPPTAGTETSTSPSVWKKILPVYRPISESHHSLLNRSLGNLFQGYSDLLGPSETVYCDTSEEMRKQLSHGPSAPMVTRIAITGGPCSGKTSALAALRVELENRNYRVYVVPEAVTIMVNGGFKFSDQGIREGNTIAFQVQVARVSTHYY